MNNKLSLSLLLFSLLLSTSSLAERTAIDAVVILDSSGSMKKTDPRNLRKSAARMFVSLLDDKDRVSIMSFSDNGYPITYLTPLDSDSNVNNTQKATDKISHKGIYTNIYAAIDRGMKILSDNPSERKPIIILLSDGKMDVGDDAKSDALSQKLKSELAPLMEEAKVQLFSIAFTEQSDQALLTEVSEKTGGFCKIAQNDEELHHAFTSIFEENKQPDMLPLTENKFLADESINEITIVASKETIDSKIFLEDPEAKRFDASKAASNMRWFISESFDMITIKKPKPGEWKILFSDNNNKAYIVADMSMKYKFDFVEENDKKKMQAHAWLVKEDEIVTEDKILDSVTASLEINSPSEKDTTLNMGLSVNQEENNGHFIVNFTPTETGTYFATVTLKSQTFERQKTFSFFAEVPAEPVTPQPEKVIEAKPEPEPTPEPPPEPVAEEDDNGVLQSILVFVALNILIIILGLVVYLVLKIKKDKQQNTDSPTD